MQARLFAIAAVALFAACSGTSRPHLPAITERYRHVDNTVTFELPDSAGFLANGVPVAKARIASLIAEIFAQRRPELRAVFVVDNPARDWADVELIQAAARAVGGEAFDAKLSGLPSLRGFTELPPIEHR